VRGLVTGALVFTTDHLPPSTELVLTARPEAEGVVLSIATRSHDGDKGFATEPGYRKLEWHDLEALAGADGAVVSRDAGRIDIRLPWMKPA
jgi:hypothetical protein